VDYINNFTQSVYQNYIISGRVIQQENLDEVDDLKESLIPLDEALMVDGVGLEYLNQLGEFSPINVQNIQYSSALEALLHYEWIGSDYGPIYSAMRANDVNAVALMLELTQQPGGYTRRVFREPRIPRESQCVVNRERIWKVLCLLSALYGDKKECPKESLEIFLSAGAVHDFPLISYNYDLDIFELGLKYRSPRSPLKIYTISAGGDPSQQYVVGLSISRYLKVNPDDSEEIVARKRIMYDSINNIGYPY